MNNFDNTYLNMLNYVIKHGREKSDRTGTGTLSVFGYMMKFDLSGFRIPLLTTKKIFTKSVIHELLWFLRGSTNIKYLVDNGVSIWTDWPYAEFEKARSSFLAIENSPIISPDIKDFKEIDSIKKFEQKIREDKHFAKVWGNVGNMYGEQWINWKNYETKHSGMFNEDAEENINQLTASIEMLKKSPDSRRNLISAWNVADLKDMALPPCHYAFQLYSTEMEKNERKHEYLAYGDMQGWEQMNTVPDSFSRRKLSLMFIMRSVDIFLGMPFDIASYGILMHMIANVTNHVPGELTVASGDTHLYLNHIEQAGVQLNRNGQDDYPILRIPKKNDIFDYKYEDFEILNYDPEPYIKAPIAV